MNRKEQIIDVGIELWETSGARSVTARNIASEIGLTHPTVLYHFSRSSEVMRTQIAKAAINRNNAVIVCELIAMRSPLILDLTTEQRQNFLNRLMRNI